MRLHDLSPAPGSTKDRKRLGRGNASGQGTTAGKGTKGQKARSGGAKAGFRGVTSRNQRMAKRRGFTNVFKTVYQIVNVSELSAFENGTVISPQVLKQANLVSKATEPIKLLGDGEITVALTVEGLKLSGAARQKIEAAGGSIVESVEEETGATGSA
jgi:large subunit ribosomal protein L15